MKITLNHNEIIEAFTQFVVNQGISLENKHIEVTMPAHCDNKNHSVDVEIVSEHTSVDSSVTEVKASPKPARKPRATKAEMAARKATETVKEEEEVNVEEASVETPTEDSPQEPTLDDMLDEAEEEISDTKSLFGS